MGSNKQLSQEFYSIGISYKKADVLIRGLFSIDTEQYTRLLEIGPQFGIEEFFVISTCNRTEIYAFACNQHQLMRLMCDQDRGSIKTLSEKGYFYKNGEAVAHLFRVAGGLDSQILGDYEIVGQLKQAVELAREHGRLGPYTERLISIVLSASKDIKNKTLLSRGTISVSYATVQYLHKNVSDLHSKRILVIGAGAIGSSICKNLLSYTQVQDLTILNRTSEKAKILAAKLGVKWAPLAEFNTRVTSSDLIILATNSQKPVLSGKHLWSTGAKIILDLSIPRNVEDDVLHLHNITFIDVDSLSQVKDITLQQRRAEIPKAEKIIRRRMSDFFDWKQKRRHAPFLKALKIMLGNININSLPWMDLTGHSEAGLEIHRIVQLYAKKVSKDTRYGCLFIEAITMYINSISTYDYAGVH